MNPAQLPPPNLSGTTAQRENSPSSTARSSTPKPLYSVAIHGPALAALVEAPECVKKMAEGQLPRKASEFDVCVCWLAQQGQLQGLQDLVTATPCKKFHAVNLSGQPLSVEALGCIAKALRARGCVIRELRLVGCGLGAGHAKALGEMLAHDSSLIRLELGSNALGGACVVSLCEGLRENQNLLHLNLDNCQLKQNDCRQIFEVLSVRHLHSETIKAGNTTLQSLSLEKAAMCTPGWLPGNDSVYAGLGEMPGLVWLNLSDTDAMHNDEVVATLFGHFTPNGYLKRLDISRATINHNSINTLWWNLRRTAITHLAMSNTVPLPKPDGFSVQDLLGCLMDIPSLKLLDVRASQFVFGPPGGGVKSWDHLSDKRIKEMARTHPNLMCMMLNAEEARRNKMIHACLTAAGAPGAKMLTDASTAFIYFCKGVAIAHDTATLMSHGLDVWSGIQMMSVNKELNLFGTQALGQMDSPGFHAELAQLTGDPGFDWDELWIDRDEPEDGPRDVTTVTTTTSTAAITTTTSTPATTSTTAITTTTSTDGTPGAT